MKVTALLPLMLLTCPAADAAVTLTRSGNHSIGLEGLIQGDANSYDSDRRDLGDDRLGRLRRAEFILKGAGGGPLDWVLGWDAKSEKFLDVNLRGRWKAAGLDHSLQAGQFKQPNSLEELSSTKGNDFIAKAAITNTFAVSRRLGAGYGLSDDRWSLAASMFGDELTGGGAEGDGWAARATWAPLQHSGKTLHLGLSHAHQEVAGLRIRARPNADLTDVRLVDTGMLDNAHRHKTTGLEALWLAGPLKLQAEHTSARTKRHQGHDVETRGLYASALYNLGGSSWKYDKGLPSPPSVESNSHLWQLGARIDRLDLDDGDVRGGRMQALTLGLNWLVGEHLKVALNQVWVDSERLERDAARTASDDPAITELRVQLHW